MKTKRRLSAASRSKRKRTLSTANGTLTAKIVRIGNSRGIRLPKTVIEQAGLEGDVEITVSGDEVILRRAGQPRAGWAEAFRRALSELPPDFLEKEQAEWADWQNMPNEFDEKEWTW